MALSSDSVFMLVSIFSVALFVLITTLWLFGPTPKKVQPPPQKKITLEEIMGVLDNPKSTLLELQNAADNFFKHYNELNLSDYRKKSFLFAITIHKNTSTSLIIRSEEQLSQRNPELKRDFVKTLSNALDAREVFY